MRISAIIVTRNREHYLRKSLDSLINQELGREDYEIIVVDNGSRDATAAIVREGQRVFPNLRYEYVAEEGSSRARNAGVAAASAPIVAFLDDDAIAPPAWLQELLAVFGAHEPPPACVGGKILPLWESAVPDWFPKRYLPSLSMLDMGDETICLGPERYIVGANMALLKDEVLRVGGFNDDISLYADEIYIQDKLRAMGEKVYYAPHAWVYHHVPAGRLTVEYLCNRKYRGGKGEVVVILERKRGVEYIMYISKNIVGRPFRIAYLYIVSIVSRVVGNKNVEIESMIQMSRSRGMMEQAAKIVKHRLMRV